MKKLVFLNGLLAFTVLVSAQIPLTVLPSGGNKKASVSERVGLTDISIHYDRPGVKGREGKIWGQLVHKGFTDQGFGNSKAAPWRAGANENTTISFSTDVRIEGQPLPAGTYGFFIAYDPEASILIFSKNHSSWGSYFYDEKEDALRVTIRPQALGQSVEWLKYDFSNQAENAATISLQWEKLAFPFRVEVDYIRDQIESFRRELRTDKGFIWQSWNQAALWCVQRNTNLEQALAWTDSSTNRGFGGSLVLSAWNTRAQVLQKLGRTGEAVKMMDNVLHLGTMNEVHTYARQLVNWKLPKEAMEVFKKNHDKFPGQFTTLAGLMRGYAANGDFINALKFANLALPLSPDENNRVNMVGMIEKLKKGESIN
jgi:hypothetical protein